MICAHRGVRATLVGLVWGLSSVAGCSAGPTGGPPPASPPASPATAPASAAPTGIVYEDRDAGFSLVLPAGFQLTEKSGSTAGFTLPGRAPGSLQASLRVSSSPTDADLATVVADRRTYVTSTFPAARTTVDEPTTLPNGVHAWLLGATYNLRGAEVRILQLVVVEHRYSAVVTGLTSAPIFDRFDSTFRSTFSSFAPS